MIIHRNYQTSLKIRTHFSDNIKKRVDKRQTKHQYNVSVNYDAETCYNKLNWRIIGDYITNIFKTFGTH